ncbi:SMI1/KNR4 family protein [Pseudomonas sp. SWI6]|uniref:SMI1/KNR4 family protein n=1 Tax=unclassified Pseudomonas TaxID=196821 RepID=UPI000CE5EDE6|nr:MULTISPECIES: SMI1/KNR4 family protein [unclassified Pseudomonas]AVD83152.1 SMI1/KNR4 family protein [Pseudomonas sp. SWI6]AVD90311.1 SMI1/KNR4 family protein [Pseudomonas sp. SWI44]
MSKVRVIGTTIAAIKAAELELQRTLPESFVNWLLSNNGRSLGGVNIFPVYDDRDPRKTWESIVRVYNGAWTEWLDVFSDEVRDFSGLLPFAEFGTGDFYCFDYSELGLNNEPVVGVWDHETGEFTKVSDGFDSFIDSASRQV